jgi:Fe-Mn family superoxide dismutase
MEYKEQQFNLPSLDGISEEQIKVHLGLYSGYVKHVNLIREKIAELSNDKEKNGYLISELRRRFSFEFDGMRMHEYYFEGLEGGAKEISEGDLKNILAEKYGSFDAFIEHFKAVGMSRGIGWTVLYFDNKAKTPHVTWVSDHEQGVLAGLPILIAMDMWEHAFMVDYTPAEKGKYIDTFLSNLNWEVVEKRFSETG